MLNHPNFTLIDWPWNRPPTYKLLALSGSLHCDWLMFWLVVAFSWFFISHWRHLQPFWSWQKVDRPDNGDVEPWSIQKKECSKPQTSAFSSNQSVFETRRWIKKDHCDISPLTVETLALQFLEFPVRCADVWNYAKSFLDSIFLVIKD